MWSWTLAISIHTRICKDQDNRYCWKNYSRNRLIEKVSHNDFVYIKVVMEMDFQARLLANELLDEC